jgi:hypothetical protein
VSETEKVRKSSSGQSDKRTDKLTVNIRAMDKAGRELIEGAVRVKLSL